LSSSLTRRLKIASARSEFLTTGGSPPDDVPSVVAASWQRSAHAGVDAVTAQAGYDGIDVRSRLAMCSQAIIDRLSEQTADMPMSIVLTDSRARVLSRVDTDRTIGNRLEAVSLAPGFNYAEGSVGTNGIGTVFESGRPVFIVGPEHFHEKLQPFACAGSPIRDPLSGRVEGVLDISCLVKDSSPLMVSLVVSAALEIERRLLMDRSPSQQALFDAFIRLDARMRGAVMAIGDTVVMANAMAQSMFDANEQMTITEHARGLTHGRDLPIQRISLTSGKTIRLRGTRILEGRHTAGIVVAVDITCESSDAPASTPPPKQRAARPAVDATPRHDGVAQGVATGARPVLLVAGSSPLWRRAHEGVTVAMSRDGAVLVMGEPGCGKATLAAAVHQMLHPDAEVVPIEAAALLVPDVQELIASAQTGGGPALLLFKNIDQLDGAGVRELGSLLGQLAEHGDKVHAVATLNDAELDSERPFRELLTRFRTAVTVPPLRHRMSDLPDLVAAMVARLTGDRVVTVSPAALRVLSRYPWPHNLRQLEGALQAALLRRPVGEIQVEDLPGFCHSAARRQLSGMEAMERDLIAAALRQAGGNRVHAAAALGIARSSLYRKMKSFGITAI